ncbi:hypothetical protein Zmor_008596 [Zophobas morio]|uniref:Uncharacterized protein n=1 Tax=Zophobas morio TaxID=2755281 RepID=A0AA38J4L9_9CUCU|nr:hypothetical protein Zmor_008596 [Zophobas morio]
MCNTQCQKAPECAREFPSFVLCGELQARFFPPSFSHNFIDVLGMLVSYKPHSSASIHRSTFPKRKANYHTSTYLADIYSTNNCVILFSSGIFLSGNYRGLFMGLQRGTGDVINIKKRPHIGELSLSVVAHLLMNSSDNSTDHSNYASIYNKKLPYARTQDIVINIHGAALKFRFLFCHLSCFSPLELDHRRKAKAPLP